MGVSADATASYLDQFRELRPSLPGGGAPWLAALRDDAIGRFAAAGFPTPALEAWKYTNLTRLARTSFAAAPELSGIEGELLAPFLLADGAAHRLVFLNGRYAPELSAVGRLPDGCTLTTLASAAAGDAEAIEGRLGPGEGDGDGLVALNTALMRDGLVLRLAPGAVVDKPIHAIHYTAAAIDGADAAPAAVHARSLVVAGAGARATVVECHAGDGGNAYWTNSVTEIELADGAAIDHVKLQAEGDAAFHTGLVRVSLGRDTAYSGLVLSTGARLARNETRVAIVGEGAECSLFGGALVRGRQHADNTTEIDHRAGHAVSRQLFKNVVDDRARSVFQGRVLVRPDAQLTDASQSNRNLLLSREAVADSKPELRIFANDVKCSHGATVGDLDRDALFYLRSRGIDAAGARALLIAAFAAELVAAVAADDVRAYLQGAVDGWLADAALGEAA